MLLTIRDETASGKVTNSLTLDVLDETITVRELIRSRVYQEVDDYNRTVREAVASQVAYNGLVKPTNLEVQLNAAHGAPAQGKARQREIDFKKQFEVACDAFERNGFFILIDDKQAERLDDAFTLRHDSQVSFVKLTPLVGG